MNAEQQHPSPAAVLGAARVRCKRGSRWAVALCLVLCACSAPLMPYSADTPPLVLAPTSLAGVQDKRARFREIYCAVLQARGLFRREYEGTTLRDHFGLPHVPAPAR